MTASEFYDEFGIPAPPSNIDETAERLRNPSRMTLPKIAMALIHKMTMEEREEFFLLYKSKHCMACGTNSPDCQCWNDE